ncbi:ATP-grasp domain-containing protein [Telmatobacter bradus]|uniref:ATP-grasp domain-containing protein n=1 Tax=Telmatobacter bradus TaxID=474953 RepID=UPI003B436B3C
MKRIGILFGIENSFPGALAEEINLRQVDEVTAEFVRVGAISGTADASYAVIIDRISHLVPFYRSWLKQAALRGTVVLNNPFWQSADDKFLNYSLAAQLGIAVPPTMLLPHKEKPAGVSDQTLRNLEFPLDWESIFATIGEHGFLKPVDGGGWRDVFEVHSRDEFFHAYDQTSNQCMVYQKTINYEHYFRCYVVGAKRVRVMGYDPRHPHAERYLSELPPVPKMLIHRMERDAIQICKALGYEFNTVEFAVANGIPYAIDFMNPVPDADANSVGQKNAQWFVEQVADLAIARALAPSHAPRLNTAALFGSKESSAKTAAKKKTTTKKSNPAKKKTAGLARKKK